ncbi:MAG: bifunctional demethylmenaquinone methyltransferase/2-methoxy-6-polyprenyl-1,4-benzoquinol methylase UbiE [Bacteroidota bacterium]
MTVVPYKHSSESKKDQVADMFDRISPRYDLLNRLLSFGIDQWWRKRAISRLRKLSPKLILDVATGTGDVAIEALKLNPDKVIGVDISEGMLELGRRKIRERHLEDKIELRKGDSEKLPFTDNFFDAVTVSFGVRNFENLQKGLTDIGRVLRPGGMAVVLEFSKPQHFPVKQFYNFYSRYILPVIGRAVSHDTAAYEYLPESVRAFPDGQNFLAVMKASGFEATTCTPLTFGIVTIYTGVKPSGIAENIS